MTRKKLKKSEKIAVGVAGLAGIIAAGFGLSKLVNRTQNYLAGDVGKLPDPNTLTQSGVEQTILDVVARIEAQKAIYAEQYAIYQDKIPQMAQLEQEILRLEGLIQPLQTAFDVAHTDTLNAQNTVNFYALKAAQSHDMSVWANGKLFGETFPTTDANTTQFPHGILNTDLNGRDWHGVACYLLTYGELLNWEQTYLGLKAGAEIDLANKQATENTLGGPSSDLQIYKTALDAANANLTSYKISVDTARTLYENTANTIAKLDEYLNSLHSVQVSP